MLCNGHEGEIYTARFSLDGSCFASAGFDMRVSFFSLYFWITIFYSQIFLWNVYGDCENFAVIKGHSGAVMDINFNTDASIIVSASTDKTVRVWDMETGACQRRFKFVLFF